MRTHLFLTALVSVLASPFAGAEPAQITRGPYPQAAAPDAVSLVWRVRVKTKPLVRYGTAPDKLDAVTAEKDTVIRRLAPEGASTGGAKPLSFAPPETRQYETRISGLKPDTKYYYAVYDGDTRLTPADASYSFHTLPVPGTERPLLIWVVGDSGTGNKVQAKVHTAMRDWTAKEKRPLDGYLHVGDMAYGSGMDTEFQAYFFQPYEATLRNTVVWPAFGNHEGRTSKSATGFGPYYDAYITPTAGESGGVPSGTESYYAFDIGKVHFISLNSYDTSRQPDGAMAQWLKADLEKTKASWIVAFFHHPPYTKGSHDSDDPKKDKELIEIRENIMPILEGGGVDLVLAGHSHIYERSFLIDGAYATPTVSKGVILNDGDGNPAGDGPYKKSAGLHPHEGTVAVVAGHGGTTLSRKKEPSPVMHTSILEFGSLLLDVKGDTLTGRMLNADGAIRDTFQVVKRGTVKLTAIENPKPPGAWQGPPVVVAASSSAAGSDKAGGRGRKIPAKFTALIPKGAEWQYLGGRDPGHGWPTSLEGADWKTGAAGFGYADDDDVTKITDMRGKYRYLCIRRAFDLTGKEDLTKVGLAIAYDDGFICYLNGKEVARDNVEGYLGTGRNVKPHEAGGSYRYFPLPAAADLLKPGKNMIAIEIHNDDLDSSDLTLDPYLIISEDAPEKPAKDPSSDD